MALMGLPAVDLPLFLRWRDDSIRPSVEPGDFEGAKRIRTEVAEGLDGQQREARANRSAAIEQGRVVRNNIRLETAQAIAAARSAREAVLAAHALEAAATERRTLARRPELLGRPLTGEEQALLDEFPDPSPPS